MIEYIPFSASFICSLDMRQWIGTPPVPLIYDDNQDLAEQPDVIIIPIILYSKFFSCGTVEEVDRHIAIAIYDREDGSTHYFDSSNVWMEPRYRICVDHAVCNLTSRQPPIYWYHTKAKKHNQQTDTDSCTVHAVRNAESWLFNNKQLYTPNLDIMAERERMLCILEQLLNTSLPTYTPPVYEEFIIEEQQEDQETKDDTDECIHPARCYCVVACKCCCCTGKCKTIGKANGSTNNEEKLPTGDITTSNEEILAGKCLQPLTKVVL